MQPSSRPPTRSLPALRLQENDAGPAAIISQLNRTSGELHWYAQVTTWIKNASEEELIAALQQVHQIPERGRRDAFKALAFERWGEIDGPMALTYLQSSPDFHYEERALMTHMCSGWVVHDPATAIEALISSGTGSRCVNFLTDETLLQQTFTTLSNFDSELATEFAIQLARMPGRKEAADAAMRGLAKHHYDQGGAAAALAWRNSLPVELRESACLEPAVAVAVNREDIAGATQILREAGIVGIGGYTLMDFTRKLSATAPQSALEWVTSLPPGDAKSHAFWGLVSAASQENDYRFLSRFPPGPATNALIMTHLDGIEDAFPERNLRLAAYLTDEADRGRIMKRCAIAWLSRSPEEAKKALPADWVAWWESKQVTVSEADVPPLSLPRP